MDSATGNYALTLLLFTILTKVIFIPFGIKQQKNQIKMARIRPKEEVIRKKYAGRTDRATQQKMQQELMELQQKENVSPMGGCLPLVVQMIVIIALYGIMRQPLTYICQLSADALVNIGNTIGLTIKGAPLTAENIKGLDEIGAVAQIKNFLQNNAGALPEYADSLAKMPNLGFFGLNLGYTPMEIWSSFSASAEVEGLGVPSFGTVVQYAIIPLVCFALQFATMKLTRKFTYQSPAQAEMQNGCSMQLMDWSMPLMSLFFCCTFSSAIGLYWIYSNILSFAQTVILAKVMPVPQITEADIKAAEKEMKEKGYELKRSEMRRVRSLHHIDDDDYEELPEVKSEVKGASNTLLNGEKVPLKDESDKKKKE